MQTIIKEIVQQEIRKILDINSGTIRQAVREILIPEIHKVIWEEVETQTRASLLKAKPQAEHQILQTYPENCQINPADSQIKSNCVTSEEEKVKITPNTLEDGKYLYCIIDNNENKNFGKIGINGDEVYTMPYQNIGAVIHDCKTSPYQSDDEEEVKNWILCHQQVIDYAWKNCDAVIPSTFDTIIIGNVESSSEVNLKKWLEEHYSYLSEKIKKFSGNAEYGVQILWDINLMAQKISQENSEIRKMSEDINSQSKGLAYMYRQKLESVLKKELENQADRYFKEFFQIIKPLLTDVKIDKIKKTDDSSMQMIMNLACLLPREKSQILGEELEKIDQMEGFAVRYTGPWPPYNFV